ncbi:MAG: glycosyltransferase [Bacteroidetes bacterium]|nr:glycosyltransferase [Bacteroidota bacterium]
MKPAILSFIDWYKPAFKAGGPVRSMSNLTELLKDNADCFVVCGNTEIDGTKLKVPNNEWLKGHNNEQIFYCKKPKRTLIKEWTKQNPDGVFHINGIYSFRFSIMPLFLRKVYFPKNRTVVSPRGMLNEGALKIKAVKKYAFIAFARGFGLFDNVTWHATSEEEKSQIKKFFPQAKQIRIISNIPLAPNKSNTVQNKVKNELRMFSVTRVVPIKRIETILNALQAFPVEGKIVFDVFGPVEDRDYAEKLVRIARVIPHLTFELKGALEPEKLSDIYGQYHLFALPSSNENFGHSIYESFAHACPVLISDKTPWHQLEKEKAGVDLDLNHLQGFSDAIKLFLQMEQTELNQWKDGAFAFAQKHYLKEEWINSYLSLFAPND